MGSTSTSSGPAAEFYNGEWSLSEIDDDTNTFSEREQNHFRAFLKEVPHLERYYNGRWTRLQLELGTTSLVSPELEHFLRFHSHHQHLVPYRTEWRVFDEELRLVGSIDMVFWDEELRAYVLYDWKRSRMLRTSNWGGKHGIAEWNRHIQDCNVEHYSPNSVILERNYELQIAQMWLLRCHPEASTYEKFQVRWDDEMMSNFVEARILEVSNMPRTPYLDEGYPTE
jgi:hypothetical protein